MYRVHTPYRSVGFQEAILKLKMNTIENKLPLSAIENVPYYGKSFPFIPWTLSSKIKVSLVFSKNLYKEIGIFSFLVFWLILPLKLFPIIRRYKEGLSLMGKSFGLMAKFEWMLLIIIYNKFKKMSGQAFAYSFVKKAIQEGALFMMGDFYQVDELAKFEDPFLAFWLYHKAMFKNDPNYPNEIIEEKDCKIMIVHNCRNCEIAKLTIPELSPIGCDHDIVGYKAIQEKTKMEFRRPETLAKDGQPCKFMFFREGTAPAGIEIK